MRTRQTRVAAEGLEVSRGSLLKDCVIESLICNELFEPSVFALKLTQAFCLVGAEATVFLAPAVVSLRRDFDLLTCCADRLPLTKGYLSLTKLVNDLFGGVPYACHGGLS